MEREPRTFRSRSARGLSVNIALATFTTIGFVFLLELGARTVGADGDLSLFPNPANCLRRDPLVGMSFRPNCSGVLATTPLRTNGLGLRGPALRASGAVRILTVGDSCTWGWGVPEDASYPAVLQRELDQRFGAGRYDVINAGVPGYSSYQGLEYLRERGLALEPAIVIIAYGFNDLFKTGNIERQLREIRAAPRALAIDDFLLNNSAGYRWIRWRAEAALATNNEARVTAEQYRHNLEEMIRLSRDHGAAVLLVSFWSPLSPEKSYRAAEWDMAQALGVPLIEYDGPKLDAVHPTVAGYHLLSLAVADRLAQERYLRAAPPTG